MKRTISLLSISLIVIGVYAAIIPPQPVLLGFTVTADTNQMGGLSPNDFSTNFVLVFQSTSNCTIPTNQWPVLAAIPMSNFTNQGPMGTEWTNQFNTVSTPSFYLMKATNYLGGVGPFSGVACWVQGAPPGTIRPIR